MVSKKQALFRRLGIAYTWLVVISTLTSFYVAFFTEKATFASKIGFIMLNFFGYTHSG